MNLFLLAAGTGTRFLPLTQKLPKPCIPFLNVPMGYWQLRFLKNISVETAVANTFHLPEQIVNLYENQSFLNCKFKFSHETNYILGHAGGLKKAEHLLAPNKEILMLNADEIYFTKHVSFIEDSLKEHKKNRSLATLITTNHPLAGSKFGAVWENENKIVKNFGRTPTENCRPKHYIGTVILDSSVLKMIPENTESNILYDILMHELKNNSITSYHIDCDWYETGNFTDYFEATKQFLANPDLDAMNFINSYDSSHLVQNKDGISLISDSVVINKKNLRGYNVFAKSTVSKNLASTLFYKNSVLFEDKTLNTNYFS